MANINKNELCNLIYEFYEENGKYIPVLWDKGYTMNDWAGILGVKIAPATIMALVREGFLVAEDGQVGSSRRNVKYYHKPYTLEEREARLAEIKRQRKIDDAKQMVEGYEDSKRRAYEIYEKCVADAEKCLKKALADYEKRYNEAIALLEENNEHQ